VRTTIAISVFVLAAVLNLLGSPVGGVALPERVSAGGTTLVLNGQGVRTRFFLKVYVGGLYLTQKSSDASAIVASDAPKQMLLHFVRTVSTDQMAHAYREAFESNPPDVQRALRADFERMLAALVPVKEGDRMAFTYVPGAGTTLTIRDRDAITIPGLPFARALFSSWLGPRAVSTDLKRGLLDGTGE
jgi:hypothetical protein